MKNKLAGLAIGVMMLGTSGVASAALITYTDSLSYDTAVGSTTLIDFETQGTDGQVTNYGGSLTVGDVTFTEADNRLYVLGSGLYNTFGSTHYLNHNGFSNDPVVINFASSVSAVGMDLGWLSNWGTGPGSSMNFVFSNGETYTANVVGPLYANPTTSLGFVGFKSDIAFSSISIYDPSASVMIDNFKYALSPSPAPVPEPATMILFGTGLAGLVAARRRKKAC